MRPITEWCGVCLQDDLKVIAVQVIEQVPLCKGCVVAYGEEKDVLRDARQFLRDMDDPKPAKTGYEIFDPSPEPQAPSVKHFCVCGCGTIIPEGQRLADGHGEKAPTPTPPSSKREPDQPFTKEQRATLMATPVVSNPKKGKPVEEDRFITKAEIDKGLEMLKRGTNMAQVARELGLPYQHVRHHVLRAQQGILPPEYLEPEKPEATKQIVRRTMRQEVTQEVEHWTAGSERTSRLTIEIPSGGRLTLECECHLFDISAEDRNFIFQISDRMRQYAKQKAVPLPPKHFSIVSGMDEGFIADMIDCLDQEEQNRVVDWLAEAVPVVKKRRSGVSASA